MNTKENEMTNDERPAKYDCTLCRKVHRLSQQQRDYGTDRYSMHFEWRVGGRHEIVR